MPRYRLTIAYDGTDFAGWQKQEPYAPPEPGAEPDAPRERVPLRTVQHVVEQAVRQVVRQPVNLKGASRTDSGVHARGQVAAFSTVEPEGGTDAATARSAGGWPLERGVDRLVRAINARLPGDVLVLDAAPAPPGFDPITGATNKAYSYTLHVSPNRPLWERRYVHHVWTPLDVDRMRDAAARIVGEHDFAAFAAAGHGRLTTVRTVFACDVSASWAFDAPEGGGKGGGGQRVRIDVSGSGFLYNMVRIIAGTLVEVGRGRMTPEDVTRAIQSRDRRNAGPTLPPTGLSLEWIRYDTTGE